MTIIEGAVMLRVVVATVVVLTSMATTTTMAIARDWRSLDPENTLLIDTTKGRIIVEMRPELAPKAVARVKRLAREGVYDGLQFHRVIPGFVVQTGNPDNRDGGVSRHPDLEPEFTFRLPTRDPCPPPPERASRSGSDGGLIVCTTPFTLPFQPVARRSDGDEGLLGAIPLQGEVGPGGFRGWGVYCAGVAGMGRQADPGSANSEIFFMLEPERRLDHDYTVWGRIVVGQAVLASLAAGEPPARPDRMHRVRVVADLPAVDRPRVEVEDADALRRRIDETRTTKGADASVCDVEIVARVAP